MEWNVLFFQSLLILLVASQVTNACACKSIMVNATVVEAEETETTALYARYQMRLESTFATGTPDLAMSNGIFAIMFPLASENCGRPLILNKGYIISGFVDQDGILFSSNCEIIIAMEDVNDNIAAILNGNSGIDCSYI
ncbi:hypothetical protein ACJMK2_032760 [Sinanodonta woodiana]|uniref:Uncharacterized protein n=1 Tax=Sinanodonta woodiana TaxID=1069815 RepID=A0ABD3X4L6_SINWO